MRYSIDRLWRITPLTLQYVFILGVATVYGTASHVEAAYLRIGSYNLTNNPDNAEEDAMLGTVLEAIGLETVGAVTKRLDVLTLSETDTGSAPRVASIFNSIYGVSTYEVVTSTRDSGSDRTAVVYDTSTVSLLESAVLSTGLTHHSARVKLRPSGTSGDNDLYIYSIHLKSGTGSSNATIRANEMALIRADADSLGERANILYGGDFNMHTYCERAWANMTAAGNGRGLDLAVAPAGIERELDFADALIDIEGGIALANAPGIWRGHPSFRSLHTQNPRHYMDDRFDLHFGSEELFDGSGLEYVAGSFRVFGNNGTHLLGGAIDTGTGASPDVLTALMATSDHLPVIADFSTPDSSTLVPEPSTMFVLYAACMVGIRLRIWK